MVFIPWGIFPRPKNGGRVLKNLLVFVFFLPEPEWKNFVFSMCFGLVSDHLCGKLQKVAEIVDL